eukprot:TRINITY_DN7885_c0_g2_i2.p1 TRINITY_DN7885_c0_g2~~TRINITY_DN7885_c0_g2_i2.p1  ORF type:complete len:423 (+),score=82.47 TRINITY_DN7885_c0_g2_i2:208-1476(+)
MSRLRVCVLISVEDKEISKQEDTQYLYTEPDESFLIKDIDSGIAYDIRTNEIEILEQDDKLAKLNDTEIDAWEDWWNKKHKQNMELLRAAELGDVVGVKEVLDNKKHGELIADIDTRGHDEYTSLHLAVLAGHLAIVQTLLELGARTDAVSNMLETPLHLACRKGYRDAIEVLVNYKADINARNKFGNTPLHYLSQGGWADCLDFYLQLKPDGDIKNIYGETPAEIAKNVEVRNLLLNITHSTEKKETYKRIVIKDLILHNNRADVVKSFIFKEQQAEYDNYFVTESASPIKSSPQRKARTTKILEAAIAMTKLSEQDLKARPTGSSPKKFEGKIGVKDFELLKVLGKGSFGDVYAVKYRRTGKLYAMKVLDKQLYANKDMLKYAIAERDVLCSVRSPFVTNLDFAFQTADELILVIEYCSG